MKAAVMKVLTDEETWRIIDTGYRIVEEIGFDVPHEECRRLAAEAGGSVDGAIVRMPRALVERLLGQCPPGVTLHNQRGEGHTLTPGDHFHFSGSDMIRVLDYATGASRPATYQDVVRFTRLADALPNINGVSPHVYAMDLPERLVEPATYYATLANTAKHCLAAPLSPSLAGVWIEMCRRASIHRAGEPLWAGSLLVAATPPLRFDADSLGALLAAARARMPLYMLTGGMCGASSPITLAGSLATKSASGLFMVALAQLARPGCPVVWAAAGQVIMDMQAADMAEAGPEDCLGSVAGAQIAQALGLPGYSCSFHTDSKRPDAQAGAEKMAGMVASMTGGLTATVNAGAVAKCAVASYEQMVIDDEILAFARRWARGIEVTAETLAFDAIRAVGHGGSYLGQDHTVAHLRSGENLYLGLFDRSNPKMPYEDLLERAHRRAEGLIAEHTPSVSAEHREALAVCYREVTGEEAPVAE
jgi:trimethylamine---corrinoid protein Co-methyltransferase